MIAGALLWMAAKTKIPEGLIAAVIVLGLVVGAWLTVKSVYNGIYQQGYAACDAKWTEKALDAKIKKLEQELEAARRTQESDARNDADLEAERDAWKKKVEDYENERKKRGNYCPLGSAADSLR